MASAKDIIVKPITAQAANAVVKRIHYSGKVVPNSQLHFGVYIGEKLEGAMSFGPSMDKRKTLSLVKNTGWNDFLELNRMAFSEVLPRNSESRAMAVAFRLIKKHYPHIEWIVSYSDGTQCGDGAIYRAAGFNLCGIKENKTILLMPSGEIIADKTIREQFKSLQESGYGEFPICMAKTQYSFSSDPNLKGAPTGHSVPIKEVRLAAGAEFIVVVAGEIMTMPGLPKVPSANLIKLNTKNEITGLF